MAVAIDFGSWEGSNSLDARKRPDGELRLAQMAAMPGIVPSLNGMRALSIMLVFLSHTVSNRLFPGGFGVRIFFLISGFLITRLMFLEWRQAGRIDLRSFYIRRFLRLYPVVMAFCIVTVLAFAFAKPHELNWIEPLSALLYFANFYYSHLSQIGQEGGTMPFAIFWSLSVEEHFYLLFPVLFVASRGRPTVLAAASAGVVAFCLLLRIGVAMARPDLMDSYAFYYETQYQLDSIAFGVLLAALSEFRTGQAFLSRLLGTVPTIAAGLLVIASFAVRDSFFRETLRYTVSSAAIFVGTVQVLHSPLWGGVQTLLNTQILDWIGRLSYSMYVWHFGVMAALYGSAMGPLPTFLAATGATLALSIVSYTLLELPVSRLRHRFGPSGSALG